MLFHFPHLRAVMDSTNINEAQPSELYYQEDRYRVRGTVPKNTNGGSSCFNNLPCYHPNTVQDAYFPIAMPMHRQNTKFPSYGHGLWLKRKKKDLTNYAKWVTISFKLCCRLAAFNGWANLRCAF